MWKMSCAVTFGNFFFLEPPNWNFGAELGAEVPGIPEFSVTHWGPLAGCLVPGKGWDKLYSWCWGRVAAN